MLLWVGSFCLILTSLALLAPSPNLSASAFSSSGTLFYLSLDPSPEGTFGTMYLNALAFYTYVYCAQECRDASMLLQGSCPFVEQLSPNFPFNPFTTQSGITCKAKEAATDALVFGCALNFCTLLAFLALFRRTPAVSDAASVALLSLTSFGAAFQVFSIIAYRATITREASIWWDWLSRPLPPLPPPQEQRRGSPFSGYSCVASSL